MPAFDPRHRHASPAAAIAIALYRIGQAIDRLLRLRGEACQLSPAQIQALLFLQHARPEAHTIGGLAQRLATTYATASGVADALERKGLVIRQPLEEDRRVVLLRLTEEGRQEAQALADLLDEIETVVASLPEADQHAMLRATQAIVRRLQAAGYVHVYEMCWNCQFFRRNAHPDDPRGPHHCAFVDAPLAEPNTYFECPDFVARELPEAMAAQPAVGSKADSNASTTRR